MKEDKLDIISSKVDENTKTLNRHEEILDEHTKHLERIDKTLNEHTKMLNEHTKILNEHTRILDEHTKILNEHTEDLHSIKNSLAIIEDAVTNKIPALFDANQANQEKHEEFDNRITTVENVASTNSLKISILEDNSKMHSKQLSKLLS